MIQWNLLMAEKDSEIMTLCEKIDSLNNAVNSNELNVLADNEDGLAHLSRDLYFTSKQIKVREKALIKHRPQASADMAPKPT